MSKQKAYLCGLAYRYNAGGWRGPRRLSSRSDPASPLCRNTYDCFPAINARHTSLKPCATPSGVGLFFRSTKKGGTFPDKQLHLRVSYEVGLPRPYPSPVTIGVYLKYTSLVNVYSVELGLFLI